jgi:hypothetical protein
MSDERSLTCHACGSVEVKYTAMGETCYACPSGCSSDEQTLGWIRAEIARLQADEETLRRRLMMESIRRVRGA